VTAVAVLAVSCQVPHHDQAVRYRLPAHQAALASLTEAAHRQDDHLLALPFSLVISPVHDLTKLTPPATIAGFETLSFIDSTSMFRIRLWMTSTYLIKLIKDQQGLLTAYLYAQDSHIWEKHYHLQEDHYRK
jgi:hypothetical protein